MALPAIVIRRPSDMHVHVRQGDMLRRVAKPTLRHNKYALIMPNTDPPVENWFDARNYERDIVWELGYVAQALPQLIMALYLRPRTTPEVIRRAKSIYGKLVTVKYYPYGTTTKSQFGIKRLRDGYSVFETMQEEHMVLNLHGEVAGVPSYPDAEQRFIDDLHELRENFPALRIVVEHVSSAAMVYYLWECPPNVAGTITPQHMYLTIDDVERDGQVVQPHNACLPRAKTAEDRSAVLSAARISIDADSPRFFLGSDSAGHMPDTKHVGEGCANGVYIGPLAMPLLATIFEQAGGGDWSERLEYFTSLAGPEFYGLPLPSEVDTVTLVKEDWQVPAQINGIVPFKAGEILPWKLYDNRGFDRVM